MLLKGEGSGLAIRGIQDALKKIIGSIADNRPVILDRSSFATYTSGSNIVILGYTFPAYTLDAGDVIRVQCGGYQINNTGGVAGASPFISINQGATTQVISGGTASSPTNAAAYAWHTHILFSVNVLGTQSSQYVPATGTRAVTDGSTYSSGLSSVQGIGFAGVGSTLLSNTNFTNPSFASGLLLPTVVATSGAGVTATVTQIAFDRSQPIRVEVQIVAAAANNTWNVSAGIMEGL